MPFFTIILPTYNSNKTLFSTLQSVVSQTFTDFEVLVMDGCSNDNTLQIASSFNDTRIKVFSEKDKGVYDAMNKGIDKASGEWLYFLGSDDTLYNKDVLNTIFLKLQKNIDAKIFYGNVLIDGDSSWAKNGQLYDGEFDLKKILKKNICHQCIFYHNSIFDQYGKYNLKYKILSDYDFNLKLFSKEKFSYFDIIICQFKAGGLSTSIVDTDFGNDFKSNITRYYKKELYKKDFDFTYLEIKKKAKQLLLSFNPIGFYYLYILILKKIQWTKFDQ